jgi:hypothetical protein
MGKRKRAPAGPPDRVRAAPNASRIRGRITRVRPAPGGAGQVWDVDVHEAGDVTALANLAAPRIGKSVEVYVHPDFKEPFAAGDRVEATVVFEGDERGGAFFVRGDEARHPG